MQTNDLERQGDIVHFTPPPVSGPQADRNRRQPTLTVSFLRPSLTFTPIEHPRFRSYNPFRTDRRSAERPVLPPTLTSRSPPMRFLPILAAIVLIGATPDSRAGGKSDGFTDL